MCTSACVRLSRDVTSKPSLSHEEAGQTTQELGAVSRPSRSSGSAFLDALVYPALGPSSLPPTARPSSLPLELGAPDPRPAPARGAGISPRVSPSPEAFRRPRCGRKGDNCFSFSVCHYTVLLFWSKTITESKRGKTVGIANRRWLPGVTGKGFGEGEHAGCSGREATRQDTVVTGPCHDAFVQSHRRSDTEGRCGRVSVHDDRGAGWGGGGGRL